MKITHKSLMIKNLNKNNSIPTFFGIGNKYLDINTMSYRIFGAVWQLHNAYRYIIGYWFGDNKKDLISHINCGEWTNLINQDGQIPDVYQAIREEQERELWENRFKLSNNINYQENWKGKKPGWYIIKSCKNFPCTITCIQKIKHTLWIEHVCICESENDIKKFINLINLEHNVHLILDDFSI